MAWTVTSVLCGVMACGIRFSSNALLSSFGACKSVGLIRAVVSQGECMAATS